MSHAHRTLALWVRWYEGRYHGVPDWPPSPGRLFQALVAGSGPQLPDEAALALRWLEGLSPPTVAAPASVRGQQIKLFVPNNDLDSKGGDPSRLAEIRTPKWVQPYLFDAELPCVYAWSYPHDDASERFAREICVLAERLYQLGRGVDMAWARGEILDADVLDSRLTPWPLRLYRPSPGEPGQQLSLACPMPGSLDSLDARYQAGTRRFTLEGEGRQAIQVFAQAPKPRFTQIAYNCPPNQALFELRPDASMASFYAWPLSDAYSLVVQLRDAAAERLRQALPDLADEIERLVVGRSAEGHAVPAERRIRIVPLPSIGHPHVDRGIRRVLVEVPPGGSLGSGDVFWAFSGLELSPGEGSAPIVLTPADELGMLEHYGVGGRSSRTWRTVTPAALPEPASRRRIEPTRQREGAKGGPERVAEERRAAFAVTQALRHAGVRAAVSGLRVQREPFEGKGERAEAFAPGTRFPKERLWHVELTFEAALAGPLVLGDGRFLGLGLMAPVSRGDGVFAFAIDAGLAARPDPGEVALALRRAVMARVQATLGDAPLPPFFSGHAGEGAPARDDTPHLSFSFDPTGPRVLVVAPHVRDHRLPWRGEREHLETLEAALSELTELRAGAAGCLSLRPVSVDLETDPMFAPSRRWVSVTPYLVNRHQKRTEAAEAFAADLRAACRRVELPEPQVAVDETRGVRGVGLLGRAVLTFSVPVQGPLLLGRSRHRGGGLFAGAGDP